MPSEVLLIGESNPYGGDPRMALYPLPRGSAGWRFCQIILGMSRHEYLRVFYRFNLCRGPAWDAARARRAAVALRLLFPDATKVLLGAKVAEAFGQEFAPFTKKVVQTEHQDASETLILLPHPSGRCRLWNERDARERARELIRSVI